MPGAGPDRRANIVILDEVGPKNPPVHRVVAANRAGPLHRFMSEIGVIPVGPRADLETGLLGQLFEMSTPAGNSLGIPGYGLPFRRNTGMQLERAPFDLDVVVPSQQIDPSLADIAERSNEVAPDSENWCHRLLQLRGSSPSIEIHPSTRTRTN